jgi:hypothetical protein
MTAVMRAKMRVTNVQSHYDVNQQVSTEIVHFQAVAKNGAYPSDGLDEDNTYARFTPNATCSIQIANPELFGKFHVDHKYYVDFHPAGD